MKKIVTLSAVIVLLLTILGAGGFNSPQPGDDCVIVDSSKVIIYVKAVGGNHLELYDSNDKNRRVIDDLGTCVAPGMKVVWMRAEDSGIKKFTRVGPEPAGAIFTKDAKTIILHKRYRYRVPTDAPIGSDEYAIEVKDENNNFWGIDPHLIIPPPQ